MSDNFSGDLVEEYELQKESGSKHHMSKHRNKYEYIGKTLAKDNRTAMRGSPKKHHLPSGQIVIPALNAEGEWSLLKQRLTKSVTAGCRHVAKAGATAKTAKIRNHHVPKKFTELEADDMVYFNDECLDTDSTDYEAAIF